jgi:H+/Na+-translocating ferredoxin:NAD+ oxidoreductase subunit B
MNPISAERIDALLPQTQCRQCGYQGCLPYAEAMAEGIAGINRCPPGGNKVIGELAELLALPPIALDPACGTLQPRRLAVIDETNCIGCTLCIQACPVDAIVGAAKQMHSVLESWCTGCELCVPPCPVDCIELLPHPVPEIAPEFAALSRTRYRARTRRLQREKEKLAERRAAGSPSTNESLAARKKRIVAAAVATAKVRATASQHER